MERNAYNPAKIAGLVTDFPASFACSVGAGQELAILLGLYRLNLDQVIRVSCLDIKQGQSHDYSIFEPALKVCRLPYWGMLIFHEKTVGP